mmetsp:Transcript_28665/g.42365  ORF Transcript_28665/g.42365 Transcript_28665/m.42365 type:complete len:86 (+) Transcript_28665:11-268(+)
MCHLFSVIKIDDSAQFQMNLKSKKAIVNTNLYLGLIMVKMFVSGIAVAVVMGLGIWTIHGSAVVLDHDRHQRLCSRTEMWHDAQT